MMTIGSEIHNATARGLTLPPGESKILDMCMAPGGFLLKALQINPRANAAAFTLPPEIGGHEVILKPDPKVTTRFADVTMLAEDMGVQLVDIAPDHPDVGKFLPRQLKTDETFGLVLCDGQVLRTHSRAEYRESREAHRLTATQLALGLEHLSPGGTVLILLHKFEAWRTVYLIWTFSQFSDHISIVKPTRGHGMRSSFYMVARNIRSRDQEAIHTVEKWKADWKIATFGTEDEYLEHIASSYEVGVQDILRSLGPTLVRWGDEIWNVQADALENAPFIRDAK